MSKRKHLDQDVEFPIRREPYTRADLDTDLSKLRDTFPRYTWVGQLRVPGGAVILGQTDARPSFLVEAYVQETNTIKVDILWRSMVFRVLPKPRTEGGVHHAIRQAFFLVGPQVRDLPQAFDASLERV